MGSGTTLIAAETTGRVCLGIELNPAYVDVAVERWQRFTGKKAVLDGSGRELRRIDGPPFDLSCNSRHGSLLTLKSQSAGTPSDHAVQSAMIASANALPTR